ncbi:hypothetical protein [Pectinatus brassicae]|uniref:Deoxyadenosine/deoxycytidine kinase n=1 Tax=Pectinatus brassicae TaxID=862415 RepID=A0A840UCX9_9FIRM|nr:hypothetical protein [Pectinatus brassicae]MBB5334926.1 deoxyadenosine/deoxycytidine kinase [Pectinatus brassicae]
MYGKKSILGIVFVLATMLMSNIAIASVVVPTDIYEWVQASPRISYYFNKQEMKYPAKDDGTTNTDVLEVPILEQYDWIEIQDVIEKRRWNNEDVSNFNDLWGSESIVRIDLKARTATYVQQSYLDSNWNQIAQIASNRVDKIDEMTDKNLDNIFYNKIIEYANEHKQEIIERHGLKIDTDDKSLVKDQSSHKTAKQKIQEILKTYEKK